MKRNLLGTIMAVSFLCPSALAQWVHSAGPDLAGTFAVIDTVFFAGSWGGVYRTTDNGSTWVLSNSGLRDLSVPAFALQGAKFYAVAKETSYAGIYLSTDKGGNWAEVYNGTGRFRMPPGPDAMAAVGGNLLLGAYDGIYVSSDGGMSWGNVDSGLPYPSFEGHFLVPPVISGVETPEVYAVAATGGQPSPDLLYRSSDGGRNWTPAYQGLPVAAYTRIGALAAGQLSGDPHVVALYCVVFNVFESPDRPGGVYVSTDQGQNWRFADSSVKHISSLIVAPSPGGVSGSVLLAGTWDGGVFQSYDNGFHWRPVTDNLSAKSVSALALGPPGFTERYVIAATDSGVWRRPLSEMIMGVDERRGVLSEGFALEQNFPNPFNPSTTIRYGLPNRSQVTLTVFNTLGQSVSTLVNGEQEAGYHEIKFDASGLSSGIYFYLLQAGSFTETKKLLLVR